MDGGILRVCGVRVTAGQGLGRLHSHVLAPRLPRECAVRRNVLRERDQLHELVRSTDRMGASRVMTPIDDCSST